MEGTLTHAVFGCCIVAIATATCTRGTPERTAPVMAVVDVPGADEGVAGEIDATVPSAARSDSPPEMEDDYFVGTWNGTYHETLATSVLRVRRGGAFVGEMTVGTAPACLLEGTLWVEEGHLILEFSLNECDAHGEPTIRRRLLYANAKEFRTADPGRMGAVAERRDGGAEGPVWTYRRVAD